MMGASAWPAPKAGTERERGALKTMNSRLFKCLLPLLMGLLSWSCNSLECGAGTHQEGSQCVPNIPTACGEGTRFELGYCVVADGGGTDLRATADIYFTDTESRDGGS